MKSSKSLYGIKSLYGDGSFQRTLPVCKTVGELKKLLNMLPDELPLSMDDGLKPHWFNIGKNDLGQFEHLDFEKFDQEHSED